MSNEPIYQVFPDGRMKPEDASAYTGFSKGTLANWRGNGKGPRFKKIGNRVFYYKHLLDAWMADSGFCVTTAQAQLNQLV